ncbi:MAG: hypothetical protein Q8865_06130 [Bacillota bacterium]|nr:hypothetical protein [Bacillota bacterium]
MVNINSADQRYSDLFVNFGTALGEIGKVSTDFHESRSVIRDAIIEEGNISTYTDKIAQYDKDIDTNLANFQKSIQTQ